MASKSATLSRLSRPPWALGKSVAVLRRAGSRSQARNTAAVVMVSGVQRSFRPLPRQRTWAPTPNATSPRWRPVTSDTRNPVWTVSNNRAWSRRPVPLQVSRSARGAGKCAPRDRVVSIATAKGNSAKEDEGGRRGGRAGAPDTRGAHRWLGSLPEGRASGSRQDTSADIVPTVGV